MAETKEFRAGRLERITVKLLIEENLKISDFKKQRLSFLLTTGQVEPCLQLPIYTMLELDHLDYDRLNDIKTNLHPLLVERFETDLACYLMEE